MRNYVELEKRVFVGNFVFSVANVANTKRPGVIFQFFTRPSRSQNDDPEAGCDVKVGFSEPQSHERGRPHPRCVATSELVVGRRAKLLKRVQGEHQWQAGLQLPFRVANIESSATRQGKPVSPAKRFHHGGLWALK
jgi:hypothetical protein